MSRPLPPDVTVWFDGWQRTFTPGDDVVIGRDVRADVRLPHPAVSRAHVLLRYVDGGWIAIDNESLNGMFVGNRRVSSTDVRDGTTINVGNPAGPLLTFELRGADGPPADDRRTTPPKDHGGRKIPRGSTTIGNAADNDIVITDVLASRHHAILVPTAGGARIQDAVNTTGTFVNGRRVKDAVLREGDVVTIGNVDLLYAEDVLDRRTAPAADTGGLEVRDISFAVKGNRGLLDRITFSAEPATLTAVIGPSDEGKPTLLNAIVGGVRPDRGAVSFEGHDVHADYASLRSRIGMVPQDDLVHRQLTLNQALGYAAELRMPLDTSTADRQRVIAQVLEELQLTPHAETRVEKLSGGQRKRASVALELLTGPSLLVLDEPTTGLDPALDLQVMTMLRRLADAGRVVVVATHSLSCLDICDQVLLLAPGGKPAFCGPPRDIGSAMGTTDWADIYTAVDADPDAAQRRFLERGPQVVEAPAHATPEKSSGRPVPIGLWRQFSAVGRRQLRLIVADRGYSVFLALLPFVLGLLTLAVAGDAGFGKAELNGAAPNEAKQILVFMNLGAVFMGTALTVRELVGERPIFRREQAAGLSASAYLAAKIVVFGMAAVVQSAVMVLIVTAPAIGKGAPQAATLLGSPTFELFVGIAVTCVAASIVGLFVSALAQSGNQVLPLVVVAVMSQLVLAGAFIPVTDRALDPVSWLTPARWGLAATASTADLTNMVAVIPSDSHWKHTASVWLFDIAMLGVLSVLYAGLVRWKIRFTGGAEQLR
ncbi:FHA domain-containing protein [Mycobacterium sp. URHB0021]